MSQWNLWLCLELYLERSHQHDSVLINDNFNTNHFFFRISLFPLNKIALISKTSFRIDCFVAYFCSFKGIFFYSKDFFWGEENSFCYFWILWINVALLDLILGFRMIYFSTFSILISFTTSSAYFDLFSLTSSKSWSKAYGLLRELSILSHKWFISSSDMLFCKRVLKKILYFLLWTLSS